ncbi:MAG: hypothetical protein IPH13_15375 [Planctomycetes bacterium]|nr:hypothetical protein [Planctomycetota bacterium]
MSTATAAAALPPQKPQSLALGIEHVFAVAGVQVDVLLAPHQLQPFEYFTVQVFVPPDSHAFVDRAWHVFD